jgi:hypothetical protein
MLSGYQEIRRKGIRISGYQKLKRVYFKAIYLQFQNIANFAMLINIAIFFGIALRYPGILIATAW